MVLYVAATVALFVATFAGWVTGTRLPSTKRDLIVALFGLTAAAAWVAGNALQQGPILLDAGVIRFGAFDLLSIPAFLLSALLVGRTSFMIEARSALEKRELNRPRKTPPTS